MAVSDANPTYTIGSLFTGYGGLEMGIQAALGGTAKLAWASDIDAGACKIIAHHHPDVPNIGDITTVDWSTVPPVDILTGGSPCQDLSHAGRRAGMTEGTRSNLWVAMREGIATLRPRLVIWENVRGAMSAKADSALEPCPGCMGDGGEGPALRALGRVLGDLADLGYDARWHGLRAADIGATHNRWRVFVAAVPVGTEGDPWRILNGDGLAAAEPGDAGRGSSVLFRTPTSLLPTPMTTDAKAHTAGDLRRNSPGLRAVGALLPTPSVADVEGGRKHRSGSRSGELLLNGIAHHDRWGDYAPAITRWETVLGRRAPSPTEPTGRGGAPRLSPRFVEWMMGLPDGHVTDTPDITRNQAMKALGNGVVPQQAAHALRVMGGFALPDRPPVQIEERTTHGCR